MYLQFATELFLGKYELENFQDSLDLNGFRLFLKENSLNYGIIKNTKDNTWDNGLVEQGTNVGTIKHKLLKAINKSGNFIYKIAEDNIAITDDNQWYWVKVKHQYTSNELGTVNIDINGNMVGVGTNFLTSLRGQPDFPTKIKFTNAINNILEYEVLEVLNDSNAILQGVFTLAEIDLNYAIVGTFTPGKVISTVDKFPFKYDSCLMTLVLETVLDTPPLIPIANIDEEFYIARVRRNGVNLEIEDKRSLYIYKTKTDYDLKDVLKPISFGSVPIIGIESIKFDNNLTPKDKNIVYMGWVFRSSNWTIDTNTNKITLNAGEGGKFKTVNDFTTNDFNGYRIYTKDGSYSLIKSSIKSGGQINLILDTLDYKKYSIDPSQELLITQNAEEIEFLFTPNNIDNTELSLQQFNFPITERIGKCSVGVYKLSGAKYNIQYRFKTFNEYSSWFQIPSDTLNGYYDENQFDIDGNLIGAPIRTLYTSLSINSNPNGFIILILNPIAYGNLYLGDLIGVDTINVAVPITPIYNLIIGSNKQTQIYMGTKSLATNQQINLVKNGAREGNIFWVKILADITLNAFTFKITESDAASTAPYSTILDLTSSYILFAKTYPNGLTFKLIFNGTNWEIHQFNEVEISSLIPIIQNLQTEVETPWVTKTLANTDFKSQAGLTIDVGVGDALLKYKIIKDTCFMDIFIQNMSLDIVGSLGAFYIKLPVGVYPTGTFTSTGIFRNSDEGAKNAYDSTPSGKGNCVTKIQTEEISGIWYLTIIPAHYDTDGFYVQDAGGGSGHINNFSGQLTFEIS